MCVKDVGKMFILIVLPDGYTTWQSVSNKILF